MRSGDNSEWAQEYRQRFGYLQDAKQREYSRKDVVVPSATFLQDANGIEYNAYLTIEEVVGGNAGEDLAEENLVRSKFFAQ